ncbi:hypothetical protein D3C71_1920220 [compost metagenome]
MVIQAQGRLVSGMVFFQQRDTFCMWSAGMAYDRSDFSPYTICFAAACRHAFAEGLRRFEGGRLNDRIKRRLGLSPVPLHCAVARIAPPQPAAPPHRRAADALASAVTD